MNNPFKFKKYIIEDKSEVAPETFLFRLSGKLNFTPGQFVQVRIPHIGEATLAPCSNADQKKYFELCVRSAGNTTENINKQQIGNELLVRGPYGNGWPTGKLIGNNILIVSGGMGIVPFMPLLYEILRYKKEFKKISLIAGFRTPDHVLFSDELHNFQKLIDYQKIGVEKTSAGWWGENAMITDLLEKVKLAKDTLVLMCGPEVMFRPCIDIFSHKKISPKNIYLSFERRMECGLGFCQHCTIGKYKVCEDGPVFSWNKIEPELRK